MTRDQAARVRETPAGFFMPIFSVLTLIAALTTLQKASTHSASPETDFVLRVGVTEALTYWYFLVLAYVVFRLTTRYPLYRTFAVKFAAVHAVVLICSFVLHRSLTLGLEFLLWRQDVRGTSFYLFFNNPAVWTELLAYLFFLLGYTLLEYRRRNREQALRLSELEVQLVQSQLHELRGRIHPEFLFAALRTMTELVRAKRNDEADDILSLLSDFLRATVYGWERETAPLEEECAFLRRYIDIQRMAAGGGIEYAETVDPAVRAIPVPSFLLQPLAQELLNGLPEGAACRLALAAHAAGGALAIELEGPAQGPELESEALRTMRERLAHVYGEQGTLVREPGRIRVRIPLTLPREHV